MFKKPVIILNIILVILETIALCHDIYAFGKGLFVWYTIDSNVLQLLVSMLVVYYAGTRVIIPRWVTIMHFISAVGLTVTFLIAAFVLAPEGGISYYFLENVASINHFLAPVLSVVSFLFLEDTEPLQKYDVLWPAIVTLVYGLICLVLNMMRLIDGPYFFLQVYDQPVHIIIIWFVVIAVLCLVLSLLYWWIKWHRKRTIRCD